VEGVFFGATLIFYGYLGFDFITTVSEEANRPEEDVPKAIAYSINLSMLIYAMTAFAISGVADLTTFDGDTAMALAFESIGVHWVNFIHITYSR